MLGLAVVDDLVGLQRQPEMRMQALLYPAAHRPLPRRCSATTTCDGLKRARRTSTARCGSAAPHMKMSSAAYPDSGQEWIEMSDSASTATPEIPSFGVK